MLNKIEKDMFKEPKEDRRARLQRDSEGFYLYYFRN